METSFFTENRRKYLEFFINYTRSDTMFVAPGTLDTIYENGEKF